MKVFAQVEYDELENENGRLVPGVRAICERCDHETESFGDDVPSVRRCLVLLRETCPRRERNFYEEAPAVLPYGAVCPECNMTRSLAGVCGC